jgi:hypothetical protein
MLRIESADKDERIQLMPGSDRIKVTHSVDMVEVTHSVDAGFRRDPPLACPTLRRST